MIRRYLPQNKQELVRWYERYISPIGLVGGFVADNLVLLRRVDLWTSNALLSSYLFLAAGGTLFINLIQKGRVRHPWAVAIAPFIPVVVQFSVGGLFSGFLSLYSRSAAYATSWIFVLVVAALLLGNERFLRLYTRFPFQIAILFLTLFSFLIFFLPVVTHQIGRDIFLVSGALALGIIVLFLFLQFWLLPEMRKEWRPATRAILSIYLIFNVLYFTNAIPPLPLALRDAGVYHSVSRDSSGDYSLIGEPLRWYEQYLRYNTTFHSVGGESAYVYTAIFAPSGLTTSVLHEWQRYDESSKRWITVSTISFPILGGRDGGYRGYSVYPNPQSGSWRVNVVTGYGQLIGRVSFTVAQAQDHPQLVTQTR